MAGDSEQVIRERDVQGVKYLDRVLPLLKRPSKFSFFYDAAVNQSGPYREPTFCVAHFAVVTNFCQVARHTR